jgi:hypothetical protein
MEKDVKIFGDSYLDTDTDPKLNKGSDYILNTIIQSDGRFGVAVNTKGNEKVIDLTSSYNSDPVPPTVVGSCRDEARNRIIFFVKSNYSNNSIWYYDVAANTSDYIIFQSFLILGSYIVANVIGDLLLWTDGTSEPKKINYIRAYNYSHGISTSYKYLTMSDYVIEAYKRPPSYRPSVGAGFSIYAKKVIRNKIYQFAYRYIYDDYEKSVLSPFSDVLFTDYNTFPDGSGTNYSSAYVVFVRMKLFELVNGASTDIDSIELFVRNSDFGNWYLYDKISNPKTNTFSFTYFSLGSYNNGAEDISDVRGSVSKDMYDSIPVGMQITYNSNTYTVGEKLTSGSNYVLGISPVIAEISSFVDLGQVASQWRAMTARGNNIYACITGSDICMQTNGTGSFIGLSQTFRNWVGMTTTVSGNVYASVQSGGDIYKQTAGTGNFIALGQTARNWRGMAATPSGNVYACVAAGDIYKQTSGTGNFIALGQTSRSWEGMTCDPSGNVYACVFGGDVYKQTSGSGNFVALGQTSRNWEGMTCDSFGNVYACVEGGGIYIQFAGSGNFIDQGQTSRLWEGMAVAANGSIYACVYNGSIYKKSVPSAPYTFSLTEFISYVFLDDKVKQNVDQDDLARPYDFLPKLAGTQELIEKDRIIYGDITEGFDHTLLDISTTVNRNLATFTAEGSSMIVSLASDGWRVRWPSYPINTFYAIILSVASTDYGSEDLTFKAFNITVYYVSKPGDTEQSILKALALNIKYRIRKLITNRLDWTDPSVKHNTSPAYYYISVGIEVDQGPSSSTIPYFITIPIGYTSGLNSTYKTMRNEDYYLGGIRYYDKNLRYSSVNKFNTPIRVEDMYGQSYYYDLTCSIRNKPPEYAYFYALVFTKRIIINSYIKLLVRATEYAGTVASGYAYFDEIDNYLRIQVNRLINDSREIDTNLKINNYVFTEGDRIKIHSGDISSFNYDFLIKGTEYPEVDSQYEKDYATTPSYITDSSGNKVSAPYSQVVIVQITRLDVPALSVVDRNITSDFVMELYSPKKESSNPYYFPVYFGSIGNPGASNNYHIGNVQNQNPTSPVSSPAIVLCNPGDSYLKERFAKYLYPSVDDNYSDYYESNSYGLGMPGLFDADAKEEELISGMRNSGSLLENTKVNKLNQFKSEDLETLKSKFGSINILKEVGNVMKVLQDRKETSIYISRTEMQNADNTSNVVKSTALLGTANKYDEDRGTIFPRSVVVHNRDIYYFDYYRGEVIRTSPNGQYPISEYGMRTYFRSKASQIASFGIANADVRGVYDEENKMYILTFIMGVNSETIGFYDPNIEGAKPRWISFYSFIPDYYSSLGTTLLSFSGVKGYKHNSNNVVRANFYGTKYKQQINWYSNANPILKKVFKVLGIKSNKAWDVPLIIIEPDATYTRGMQSLLKTNHFELKEGSFSAAYLNNMKTTSNTPSVPDLFNGDEMRGFYIKHQMENLEDAEVWVLESQVGWDLSDKY